MTIVKRFIKNQEVRDYVIWGIIAALVNVGTFYGLVRLNIDYRIANVVALVVNRFFCYFTNKFFVFKTKGVRGFAMIKEMISFFLARTVSFFVDYFGVVILIEYLKVDETVSKIIVAIFVIMTNYTLSKTVVFKKGQETYEEDK